MALRDVLRGFRLGRVELCGEIVGELVGVSEGDIGGIWRYG